MRSQPETSERCRAIHEVVMRAATVMRRTATSYGNSGAMRSSVARSAGSASLPVTNRVLGTGTRYPRACGGGTGPLRRAGRGSPPFTHLLGVPSMWESAPGRHSTASSSRLASAKSRSVTPLLEWVRSFTHTLPHVTSRSG